jgi:hypothetical protein
MIQVRQTTERAGWHDPACSEAGQLNVEIEFEPDVSNRLAAYAGFLGVSYAVAVTMLVRSALDMTPF